MSDYPLRGSGFISQRGDTAECPVCSRVSKRHAAATEPCGKLRMYVTRREPALHMQHRMTSRVATQAWTLGK